MKLLNLPRESQEALLNDASMFLIPFNEYELFNLDEEFHNINTIYITNNNIYGYGTSYTDGEFENEWEIELNTPYKIGDKVYLQEDFFFSNSELIDYEYIEYCLEHTDTDIDILDEEGSLLNASQMQENQSRYKAIIKDIKVIRVQEIDIDEWYNLSNIAWGTNIWLSIKNWYNEQYGEKEYSKNPYVFLYEIEKVGQ